MKYKRIYNIIRKNYVNFKFVMNLKLTETLWLSLGENCLTDSILHRYGLKSFSSVYSHGRSNIDYALFLEEIDYEDFLVKDHLKYDILNDRKVVRSSLVVKCDPIFQELQMNGFEFTHHDILKDTNAIESYERKIKRQLNFKKNKNFVFLYHHRINDDSNFDLLFKKLDHFTKYYHTAKYSCKIIAFTQNIVENKSDRNIIYEKINENIHFFKLSTTALWEGDGDDFWAKNDEDLIKQLIQHSQLISKQL